MDSDGDLPHVSLHSSTNKIILYTRSVLATICKQWQYRICELFYFKVMKTFVGEASGFKIYILSLILMVENWVFLRAQSFTRSRCEFVQGFCFVFLKLNPP